jgi:hypothetical protein
MCGTWLHRRGFSGRVSLKTMKEEFRPKLSPEVLRPKEGLRMTDLKKRQRVFDVATSVAASRLRSPVVSQL